MNSKLGFITAFVLTVASFLTLAFMFSPLIEEKTIVLSFIGFLFLIIIISFKFNLKLFGYGVLGGLLLMLTLAIFAIIIASQLH